MTIVPCPACGQDVTWARRPSGSMVALDPNVTRRGTVILTGMPPVATELHDDLLDRVRDDGGARLYLPHRSTCPRHEDPDARQLSLGIA